MQRRIERLEERLRAMQGGLRLRGVWGQEARVEPPQPDGSAALAVPRLRLREREP